MNSSHRTRFFALLALALFLIAPRAGAQFTNLGLTVSFPTSPVAVGSSLTYTMFLTNSSIGNLLAVVTNSFAGPVNITSVTNSATGILSGTISNSDNLAIFSLYVMPRSQAQLFVTVSPTNTGSFTNSITLFEADIAALVYSTNIVSQATNPVTTSDLGVTISGPAMLVYSNDWTTYRVTVTNVGISLANVMLTNTIPSSVGLISMTPTNAAATNHTMVFNLGTMTNGASRTFAFQIQPTNAGVLPFSAAVGAANFTDANLTNNVAVSNFTILDFVPASLTASNVTAMSNNPQTGLMNQLVRLSNNGTNAVQSARIMLVGLTNLAPGLTNQLYNAVGTNNGNPFVVYGNTLNTNESVDILLEYYTAFRKTISVQNSNYAAVAVASPDSNSGSGTNGSVYITNIFVLSDHSVLIEFPAQSNRTYTILYRDGLLNTNTLVAQPSIVAPANWVQWIDDGPPKTISHPISTPSRMYWVRQEP